MKSLNLNHLHTFAAVVEYGSFSAAAERLGVTQPAVSLQVRQLERTLGAPLIERVGRKAKATAAGIELLAHADVIDAAVASAVDAVTQYASGVMGRVCIGTGATACIFLLPEIFQRLRKKYPSLDITVTTGNTTDIVKAVEENVIDIALVTLPASGRMLDVTPVLEDAFVAIAPPGTTLPKKLTAAHLADLPLLLFEPGGNTRQIVDAWLSKSGIKLKPAMSLGSVEAIKAMVAADMGCAVLPGLAISNERNERFITRPLSPKLSRRLAVVIRRDKRLTHGLRAVRDALLDVSQS